MADKNRRKQLKDEYRLRAREDFETGLPIAREKFKGLFDFLDLQLSHRNCTDDLSLTVSYLNSMGLANVDEVINWLNENGAYCDCEVLANVEEQFESFH